MIRTALLFLFIVLAFQGSAQCTPNLSCLASGANSGVCPSSGLDTGTVGMPYSEVVSLKIPADGSDFGQPLATILHVDILSVDSLAPGLTYSCSASGCSFPGNSTGCILVHGTPTSAWDHKMTVHAKAYVRILFVNTSQPQTLSGFYSVILNPSGIVSSPFTQFELEQNNPNPFDEATAIRFSSAEHTQLDFKVFDMMGALVYERKVEVQQGENLINLEAGSFAPGLYVYSLGNEQHTAFKRMVIMGK